MTDRVADTTALLAEWEKASGKQKPVETWGRADGHAAIARIIDSGDALAAALTASDEEWEKATLALREQLDSDIRSLRAKLAASVEREQQLREALEDFTKAVRPSINAFGGELRGSWVRARVALSASSEGQTP